MSTEVFKARHGMVIAVQYDGSQASIQRLRELLPGVEVNAPIGVGNQMQLDGGELLSVGMYAVIASSTGKFRMFEREVFEDLYEPDVRYRLFRPAFAGVG